MADVKDQIKKILNIANDDAASEAEVENALAIAARLMAKHHLSEDDLADDPLEQAADIQSADRAKAECYTANSRLAQWEVSLASTVAKIVGGIGYYKAHAKPRTTASGLTVRDQRGHAVSGSPVVFYGIAEDVATAGRLWHELRQAIIALARLRYGSVFRGDGAAYAEGFVSGLENQRIRRAEEERTDAQRLIGNGGGTGALILVERRADLIRQKGQLATTWLASAAGGGIKLRTTSGGGSRGSGDARGQGRSDGGAYSVNGTRSRKIC